MFLASMLCLTAAVPPARAPCPEPPHFDVLAFHPLSVGDPDLPARSRLDVSIADAAKVTGLLRRAEALGSALPAGAKPVWATELNWESAPPSPDGVAARTAGRWVSRALHRLWVAGCRSGRLAVPGRSLSGGAGRHAHRQNQSNTSARQGSTAPGPGGDLALARPKAFLAGFTFPFDPLRAGRSPVRVWALLPPGRETALLSTPAPLTAAGTRSPFCERPARGAQRAGPSAPRRRPAAGQRRPAQPPGGRARRGEALTERRSARRRLPQRIRASRPT